MNKPSIKDEFNKEVDRINDIIKEIESAGFKVDYKAPSKVTSSKGKEADLHAQTVALKKVKPTTLYNRSSVTKGGVTMPVSESTVRRNVNKNKKFKEEVQKVTKSPQASQKVVHTVPTSDIIEDNQTDFTPPPMTDEVVDINIVDTVRDMIEGLPEFVEVLQEGTNKMIVYDLTNSKVSLIRILDTKVNQYEHDNDLKAYTDYLRDNESTISDCLHDITYGMYERMVTMYLSQCANILNTQVLSVAEAEAFNIG